MHIRSDALSGRGGLTLMVSALGLALIVTGGVITARVPSDSGRPAARAVVDTTTRAAFVVAPSVRLERARAEGAPPADDGRHPAAGVPLRLVVPGLAVDAPVVRIRAPGGVLVPPADPQVLGWWRAGARPGARTGSALVTGHTVSSGGGAFDHLETLRAGDPVTLRTTNGLIRYRVTGVTVYRKARLADDAERLFDQSVPGRLVLVTCEDWNGSVYLSNVVVFAEPLR